MNKADFYQGHLDRVSRSFAVCISRLEDPLRGWVGLTYLLCRVLDTVEDANWADPNLQQKTFDKFDQFINSKERVAEVVKWAENFPEALPDGEKELIKDLNVLLEDLHQSPSQIKKPIQDLIKTMSAGMRDFASQKAGGAMRLQGLKDVNRYCFFVAGIVGEALSKLLSVVDARLKITRPLMVDAHHFGLFLQKVNLLKDQTRDEEEGRFLVPSREETFLSLKENAEGAMRYIEALPIEQVAYRVFCLWSLFLGLRTLPILKTHLKTQSSGQLETKIPREETLSIFKQIENTASDLITIRESFDELIGQVFPKANNFAVFEQNSASLEKWAPRFYTGVLSSEDFKSLKMAN